MESKPKTIEELFEIKGLGEVKISKYGNDILKIINLHDATELNITEEVYDKVNIDVELQIRSRLKEFRTETAKKEKLKPFMIFNNNEIEYLIKVKSKTEEELLEVKGFGKIIAIYNQGISQVIDAIQKLTVEIRTQKAEIETLSKENKLLNKRVKSLESQVNKNSNNSSKPPSTDGFKKKTKSLRTK